MGATLHGRDVEQRQDLAAVSGLPGVSSVDVVLDVMSDAQRGALKQKLRGGRPEREIPFAKPGSLTRVFAVASGKGGVGKSSVTANLAAAIAQRTQVAGVDPFPAQESMTEPNVSSAQSDSRLV